MDVDKTKRHQEHHRVGVFNSCLHLFLVLTLPGDDRLMTIDVIHEYYKLISHELKNPR